MKRIGLILIGVLLTLFFFAYANIAFAGFGVSPSEVYNNHLRPGSHFEQVIYLVQSKPEQDLQTQVEVDAPEIKDWISFEQGSKFIIPTGNQQFPLKVIVDVPQNADFKNYGGMIWVKTMPVSKDGEGMVRVALGAVISLNLRVGSEEIYGFAFRGMSIKDAEKGRPIIVTIAVQNVGNTESKLSKVHLDVYDAYLKEVLQSSDVTKLESVKPFETKNIEIKFPNKLDLGTYFGKIQIFKDEQTIGDTKQAFNVLERTGIVYKIFSKWFSWAILALLIVIAALLIRRKQVKTLAGKWKDKKRERKKIKLEQKLEKLKKE